MRFAIFILLYFTVNFIQAIEPNSENKVINVLDYGAKPNDEIDDTAALRKAVADARVLDHVTLYFPAGRYYISDPKAIKIQNDALFGKMGQNPEGELYRPNTEYVIGLDFKGANNLIIEAKDVELFCDGWMEPLSFRNCKNITINGITIDYKRPPNSAGKIIKLGKNYVDVKFPESEPVREDLIMPRIMIYDLEMESLTGQAVYFEKKKMISPQTIRFYGNQIRKQAKTGRILIAFSGFHYRPAILLYKSKNIILNDVSIHAQAGMGIVGHLNENITMNRLKVVPRKGRYVSSNTDATHFATNRGFIHFNNCEFAGQGDDATNVHTYYSEIINMPETNICTIFLGENNFTHSLYLDEPQAGDVFAVVVKKTLKEVGYIRVKQFWTYPKERKVKIEFEGKLPKDFKSYYLINTTACPGLEFINCKIRSHRARSVLVKTRKVLIEGCSFENTTGTAIHIGTEGDWKEGPASHDVIVRNNTFTNCGIGGANDGTMDGASAIAVHVKAKKTNVSGLHKRILIENNTVDGGVHAIVIKGAEDVLIQNNTFINIQKKTIITDASVRVKAIHNKGAKNFGEDEMPVPPWIEK